MLKTEGSLLEEVLVLVQQRLSQEVQVTVTVAAHGAQVTGRR